MLAADRAPLPVLSARSSNLGLGGAASTGPARPPIEKGLGLDWTLERGNKRALRTQAAREAAEAAGLNTLDVVQQQQLAAAGAFYDLLSLQEQLAQLDELVQGAAQLAVAAQRRQSAGDISLQEALRTDIEAQRTLNERRALQAERERAAIALAQLTGLGTPLTALGRWPSSQQEPPPAAELSRRPDVQAAQRRLEAARVVLEGARALRRSDLTLGTSVSQQNGATGSQLELRLQLPLAGVLGNYHYEGEIQRAQAQLDQAADELERTRRQAQAEQAELAEALRAAASRARSFESDIVPRARRVAEMSELAYARGALALVDLIDARRTLRAVLLEQTSVRAQHARALAAWQLRVAPAAP